MKVNLCKWFGVCKWMCKRLECRRKLTCVSNEYHGLNRKNFGSLNLCSSNYKWTYFTIMGKFDHENVIVDIETFT